ncbi:MAG: thymidylate synthase, partial [Actinobacteria bacterium]|nr:thymidylate synthase [Actinomycetota bacterium]
VNLSITIDPRYPFMQFDLRTVNMDYIRRELRWYIGADRFDTSIGNYAKIWLDTVNPDGSLNSNYGQYWFGKQQGLITAIMQLWHDKYSRRANIPMIQARHIKADVKDSVCTEAMNLLIRKDKLHLVVHMRSSDQVFGLGNDLPTFSFVQHLALAILRQQYPELEIGYLTVTAASSHIYDRHYDKTMSIARNPSKFDLESIKMPEVTADEAYYICQARTKHLDPSMGPMSKWLMETTYDE